MSKQRRLPHLSHLVSYVGFLLLTVSAGAGQVGTTRPGEPVERHLSSDLTMREWTHKMDPTENIKRVPVCRVETVCKMRYKEGEMPRMRVRNLVVPLRYDDENIALGRRR